MADLLESLQRALVSRYRIERELGRGGMATVFLAEDLKHHRRVALKVLHRELATSVGPERFLREIETVARLTHPHILPLHDSGDADGLLFYVMPYIEGESLRDRLTREKQLPLEDALRIAREVADALSYAHDRGLVHRDIKPENIMIQSGHAVVADFGIARAMAAAGGEKLTATAIAMGTPAYMSPEQAAGGRDLDGRSDLYNLACVLYEMLAGVPPFAGTTAESLAYQHLSVVPRPVTEFRPAVPLAVVEAIACALAKTPADRYRTVAEFSVGLAHAGEQALAATPAGRPEPHVRAGAKQPVPWAPRLVLGAGIVVVLVAAVWLGWVPLSRWIGLSSAEEKIAVLPFENIGGHTTNQAFCDGVMETVTSSLTRMEQFRSTLWVVPATEVRRASVTNARDAARALGVNLVVTGSMQRQGSAIRLITILVDARSLRQLRSREVSLTLSGLAELQDWVIQATADMLDLELAPSERRRLVPGATNVADAYDLYLQAQGHLQRRASGDLEQSVELFRAAIARDPAYALAYAGLGEAYWRLYRASRDSQWVTPARENCRRALLLSDVLAPAYRTLGMIEGGSGRYDEAIAALQHSLRLEPSSVVAYIELGVVYDAAQRQTDAERAFLAAKDMHPGDWSSLTALGLYYYRHGRYAEARPLFERAIELVPDNHSMHTNLGSNCWMAGQYEDAIRSYKRSLSIKPTASAYTSLGTIYFFMGRCAEAVPLMEKATTLQPKDNRVWANLADTYSCIGSQDKARAAYKQAITLAEERLAVNPNDAGTLSFLALYWARVGERAKALPLMVTAESLAVEDRNVRWRGALVYELCGRREDALKDLEAALRLGQPVDEVRKEPALAALRVDPRFESLLEKAARPK